MPAPVKAPSMVPSIVPRPPNRLVPPSTTAAMTSSSNPPPAFEDHATEIMGDGDEFLQTFGTPNDAPPLPRPDTSPVPYMFYKGGTLHFGKLLMLNAEMQIVDLHPSPFFNFSLDRYKDQLIAGYERTLPDLGLEVYMLGLDKLGSTSAAPASPSKP